ncbi:transmembrane adaptor Erv26-domain-containing protein [Gloeopeniophorella convolvens]|nr:transmembrane adaptor Erv26-domain-containing protein [Gloeopeniophorella convolvens]
MALLHLLSYAAVIVAFMFVTLSLASGLLWLSEVIEEHSKLAKVLGKRGIYVIISIHVLLAITDGLPLHKVAFSILCHAVYLQNFSHTWPVISLTSPSFVASCVLVVADHFLWPRSTARTAARPRPPRAPAFGDMATFFGLCVWLAPLFLFLSLSANDNTLPTSGSSAEPTSSPTTATFASAPALPRTRSSLFRTLFGAVPGLRRASARSAAEGLIAPPSPRIPPPSPTRSTSYGEFRDAAALAPDLRLTPPPPRRVSPSSLLGGPIVRRRGSEM